MNIVITSGGTSEKIDMVRKITNSSSGRLGSIIADKFTNDNVYYICAKNSIKPQNKNIKIIEIEGTKDLESAVKDILINNKIDVFIHSMAVSDYMVDYVTTSTLLNDNFNNTNLKEYLKNNQAKLTDKKISSYEEDLIIRLIKTPKIIHMIKELSPSTLLIGFKLLDDVSKEELIDVAIKLKDKNNCDYVVANDLKNINATNHLAYIIDKNNNYIELKTKEEIALNLYQIVTNLKQ